MTLCEYLGQRNDNVLDFGPVIADGPDGISASTYVTLENNTDQFIYVSAVLVHGDGFSLPQLPTGFATDHAITNLLVPNSNGGFESILPPGAHATVLVRFDPQTKDTANPGNDPYAGALEIHYQVGSPQSLTVHKPLFPLLGEGQTPPTIIQSTLPTGVAVEVRITDRPLYVITHGGEPFPVTTNGALQWATAMEDAIVNADPWFRTHSPDGSFITFDWVEDAGRLFASGFVQAAGERLAEEIMSNLSTYGSNPRIHLIGHSLGTVVNNEAAKHLKNDKISLIRR